MIDEVGAMFDLIPLFCRIRGIRRGGGSSVSFDFMTSSSYLKNEASTWCEIISSKSISSFNIFMLR